MHDRELYQQLLGLRDPWRVTEVRIDFEGRKVEVWIEGPPEEALCPDCGKGYRIYDHRGERQWRHLDTLQFQTILHCRIPRVECPGHGVKSIEVPWAEKNSRFTALFERLAIDVLLGCQNQTKAMGVLKLSWDEVHLIQEKAVQRGLPRRSESGVQHLGVDEKSFLKGQSYATILSDLDEARVLDVAPDRKEGSLVELFKRIPEKHREEIAAVAVDRWEPYRKAVQAWLPEAAIVHDKSHIAKSWGEAVDKVRRAEHKSLLKEGAEDLKGTKYLWLTNPEKWTDNQKPQFKELKDKGLKVGRAWALKELFSSLWEYRYEKPARNFFKKWDWWATHARLKPLAEVAQRLKRHLENILTYLRHRITNAVAEGLNSKIPQIKSVARGFRNFENFRIAILFYCGKLDLYPHKSQ